jgi:hypothetical protein
MSDLVYYGVWINWSRGKNDGSTITLTPSGAGFMVAFLAIFVSVAGGSLWRILAFFLHQQRVSKAPSDGLHCTYPCYDMLPISRQCDYYVLIFDPRPAASHSSQCSNTGSGVMAAFVARSTMAQTGTEVLLEIATTRPSCRPKSHALFRCWNIGCRSHQNSRFRCSRPKPQLWQLDLERH